MQRTFFLLLLGTVCLSFAVRAEQWYEETESLDIKQLKFDIGLLNLINGINLTREQTTSLIRIAKQAKSMRDKFLSDFLRLNKEYRQALVNLKDTLEKNQQIPKDLEEYIGRLEKEIKVNKQEFYSEIKHFEKQLEEVLTVGQRYIVEGFQPCVIPPRDLSTPVRVGQAASNLQDVEEFLATIRILSPKAFYTLGDSFISEIIAGQELAFGKMDAEEKDLEKQRLMSIMNEARNMSDTDFALRKPELAKDIIKRYKDIAQKFDEFTEFSLNLHGGISKLGQYFLNPRIIPLLQKHFNAIKDYPAEVLRSDTVESGYGHESGECTIKNKPTMKEFARILNLNNKQAQETWQVILDGKQRLWQFFTRPRSDDVDIVKELQDLETKNVNNNERMQKILELLSLDIPGSTQTYFDKMLEIKAGIEDKLRKILSLSQFNKYKAAKIDILDVEE